MLSLRKSLPGNMRSNNLDIRSHSVYHYSVATKPGGLSLRELLLDINQVTLIGATCRTSSPDCGYCASNILEQLSGPNRLNISKKTFGFGIPHSGGGSKFKEHVQGVARLRDWNGLGRMVITDNMTGTGFRLAFQDTVGANEALYSQKRHLRNPIPFKIRNVPYYGYHDHPGGMQAHGDLVAIAMEKAKNEPKHAAVYFLKISGMEIELVNILTLDGSKGEEDQGPQTKSHAATVGFAKLANHHFLLAVAGKNHGKAGIWFYESNRPSIDGETQWQYLNRFEAPIGYGDPNDNKYIGAGGGVNLVTDCSGKVYLFAMHGTAQTKAQKEYDYLQVFEVSKNGNGHINLTKKTQQKDDLGFAAIDNISFRWSGGVYVSKSGQLAVMNTERRLTEHDNDFVNGAVHIGK